MAGHCWKCRIMPVRISENGTTTPAGIAGIVYAVDHGAKIINVSFAHRNYDSGEADAVRYAAERGAIVVASAKHGQRRPAVSSRVLGVALGRRDGHGGLALRLVEPRALGAVDRTWVTWSSTSGTWGRFAARPSRRAPSLACAPVSSGHEIRSSAASRCCRRARDRPAGSWGRLRKDRSRGSVPAARPADRGHTRGLAADPATRAGPASSLRQTIFETGTFKRGFRSTFRVGRGRFEMQLLTPLASACSLSLSKAGELTVAAPAVKNLISLSIRVTTAGRYTAEVQCRGARTRRYSLGVIAMFPRGFP